MDTCRLTAGSACLCAAILAAPAAWTQGFPSRPLEIVVLTGPGGGNDRVARIVAEIFAREKILNQQPTVSNKVGGAGTVAFNYMKSRRGDPHVVISGIGSTFLAASLRPEYGISLDDITPVALLALDPQAVIVSAESPYRTFRDLIEAAKREPGSLVASYGSAIGTGRQLLWMIERETGTKFKAVSFKSGADALTSVMGGHTHLSTENIAEAMSAVEAKKLRVLAISSLQRLAVVADTPTMRELGYDLNFGAVRSFAMPPGVTREAVDRMEAAFERLYHSAAWKAHAAASYYENVWMGSAAFTQFLVQRREMTQEFMRAIGVAPKP